MKIGNKDVANIDINGKDLNIYEDFQNLVDKKLTSVSAAMLDGCSKIGSYAFINQPLLTSCEIPNSVTSLEISSFQMCEALTNIDIPASVTHLAAGNVFRGCTALADVIIRSPSLSAFGNGIFYDDANLKDLWLYATSAPRIGNVTTGNASETFGGTWSSGTHTLHVPAGSVSAYNNGTGFYEWSKYFNSIFGTVDEGSVLYQENVTPNQLLFLGTQSDCTGITGTLMTINLYNSTASTSTPDATLDISVVGGYGPGGNDYVLYWDNADQVTPATSGTTATGIASYIANAGYKFANVASITENGRKWFGFEN